MLRITENHIRVLTGALSAITSLEELHVGKNRIFTVLGDFSRLTNLQVRIFSSVEIDL